MPPAIQMHQTDVPEILNWTAVDVDEPRSGRLRLRQAAACPDIERRDAPEASAIALFEMVASGNLRTNVNRRFARKDAADAHKALEARATSGPTILTI